MVLPPAWPHPFADLAAGLRLLFIALSAGDCPEHWLPPASQPPGARP